MTPGYNKIVNKHFNKADSVIFIDNYDASVDKLVSYGLKASTIRECRKDLEKYCINNIPKGFVVIKQNPNYMVNRDGVILKIKNRYESVKYISDGGYSKVYLDSKEDKFVHKIMAEAFMPNTENKQMVNHKDGDKSNYKLSNLKWTSFVENTKHAIDTGLFNPNGMGNGRSKLTDKEVKEIYKSTDNTQILSEKYKVSKTTIKDIRAGRKWKTIIKDIK